MAALAALAAPPSPGRFRTEVSLFESSCTNGALQQSRFALTDTAPRLTPDRPGQENHRVLPEFNITRAPRYSGRSRLAAKAWPIDCPQLL